MAWIAWFAFSPPGGENVIPQNGDKRKPDSDSTLEEILNAEWDSELVADWPVAEVMAGLSDISYSPPVEAESKFAELGFDSVTTFAESSMIGYVVRLNDAAVVVFRGTDDPGDWIKNLQITSTQTPHGGIHSRFYSAYMSLKPQIEQILEKNKPKSLWVTGHSLGGALAVVCAYDLDENPEHSIRGVITFGQPMVAKRDLRDHIDDQFLGRFAHYVNGSDFVPRIPPTYTHCGSLVWFTGDGIMRSKPKRPTFAAEGDKTDTIEDEGEEIEAMSLEDFEQLQADLKAEDEKPETAPDGTPLFKGNTPFIRDHGIHLYLERIRSILGLNP